MRVLYTFLLFWFFDASLLFASTMNPDVDVYQRNISTQVSKLNETIKNVNLSNEKLLSSGILPVLSVDDQKILVRSGMSVLTSVKEGLEFSLAILEKTKNPKKCNDNIKSIAKIYDENESFLARFSSLDVAGKDKAEALSELAFGFMGVGFLGSKATLDVLLVCGIERSK